MTRDLKFRVWLNHLNQFVTDEIAITNDGKFLLVMYDGDRFDRIEHKGTVIQQFTGLKDRHGKEIYDGDIISLPNHYDYKVVFEDGKFVCYHVTYPTIGKWGDLSRMLDPDFIDFDFKVIGNIFENKDLLNQL